MRRLKQRSTLYLLLALVALILAAWSVSYINAARNQTLDQRVQAVASQIKCPVCQGESIADSPSDLARQMRSQVRQQLQEGKSEQEVLNYFRDHYGEDIIWSPQSQGFALLSWLVPLILVLGGCGLIYLTLRDWKRHARTSEIASERREMRALDTMDAEERKHYQALLEEELAADDVLFRANKKQDQTMEAR